MPEVKRPDLAAMLGPLGRALVQAELPILERNGISMWGYAVLLGLGEDPVYTQSALAKRINADKTRIIAVLDELQRRGLITRTPDPADRRARLLSLTPEGRTLRDRTQREIQAQEEHLLSLLTPADRKAFLRALQRLSDAVREQPD
ncbi:MULTISPECIES: MarR family transcriptional regulator [unclassified Nocardia]|uniref:MarR family winged helix-turn-helix transcriptional regulator n=1 Tax=unclassified Nocardia TaxID=2637762 RepID=UPI0024A88D71|nr:MULTISPECIES: MarR family transcriptional regulator [unclassified Nocardia]